MNISVNDNTIIVCENNIKKKILKSINKLINIKFFTLDNFIKNLYFDYDEKTILYIIKKYNVNYEVALEYLNNIYYIEEKKYNNEKLDFLVSLKEDLIKNKLLIFNYKFYDLIKNKKIIIYNYCLNKFNKYLLRNINYELVNNRNMIYNPKIYEFDTIEEEVEYVAREISKLINNNVSIDKIKLAGISEDYINVISKIFGFYNLKIDKSHNSNILSTVIGTIFYHNLISLEEGFKSIEQYKESSIYNKIVNICNKYVWCDNFEDFKLLVLRDLKSTSIDSKKYTNVIEVTDYTTYPYDDEYVFILGFNQGMIPKIYKDEDYISDNIKPTYLDNTNEKNILEKENTLRIFKSIKNLVITYKLKSSFKTFYPSSLIDEFDNIEHIKLTYDESYSELSDKIKLAACIDNLIKFGEHDPNLEILNTNYNIPYNTYSHKFTGIDKNKLNNYIKSLDTFNLSYSAVDDYNRCAFRFYVQKILGLANTKIGFGVTLGNIYHHVLEKAVKKNIDVRKEVYKYINDNELNLSNSNKFFIERTILNLEYLIKVLQEQSKYCSLSTIETEKYIKIPLKDNINFIGFIDKVLTNEDKSIGAIIDYKTYVKKPSLKYIDYAIGLQLPTYMYLSRKLNNNIKFAGFYLQNITLDSKSEEEKLKSLKLIGFTNTDKDILANFDNNYMESKVIAGIKINKDGNFSSSSLKHMLSNCQIDEIIDMTSNKINETVNNVLESKFDINPKYDNTNIGCEFCEFKDICFKRESDYVRIKPSSNFGGDMDE